MKMKLVSVSLLGALLTSGAAMADFDPKFYVGGEVQNNTQQGAKKVGDKSNTITSTEKNKSLFGKNKPGASLFVGSRLTENLGVEVGASIIGEQKLKISNTTATPAVAALVTKPNMKARSHNVYADVHGIIPVSEEIELLGSVGVGRLTSKLSGTVGTGAAAKNLSFKSAKTGVRFGAGVGYNLDKNLKLSLMVNNQKGNKFVKSVTTTGLRLAYQF